MDVAVRSDFSQQVAGFDKPVTLLAQNSLRFLIDSIPQGRLYASFIGTNGDLTAPSLAIVSRASGAFVNTTGPRIVVRYQDAAGPADAAASGLNLQTLQIQLDGAERTADFAKTGSEATLQLAQGALAEGEHTVVARVADVAGNTTEVTQEFRVDVTPPSLAVAEPAAEAYLATATPLVRVTYADETAIDLDTLEVVVGGVDRAAGLTKTDTSASGTIPAEAPLAEGDQQILARIRDRAGNETTAERAFHVDLTPPALVITAPVDGFATSAASVEATGVVADASPVVLRVDGTVVPMAGGAFAHTVALPAEGTQTIAVDASDAAGHTMHAEIGVVVWPQWELVRLSAGRRPGRETASRSAAESELCQARRSLRCEIRVT